MKTPARADLPAGTVTFLFTDVEGSTRLLHELGAEGYAEALTEHRRVVRQAFAAHSGAEVDTQGDAFFVAFPTAPGALAAAAAILEGLAGGPIRLRMGMHTGTPLVTSEGYVGEDVHRAARIAAAGHGGQVLVSAAAAALAGAALRDLGEHRLKDLSAPERIFQLGDGEFPPLKTLYRTNLPIPATPFLGRERELAEIVELLAGTRLLTLTGPGGTGKTRLALQAVGQVADDYPDGIFWVPLAPLRDPALVLAEAGRAVGARESLTEHVGDKQLLLLLDNFEHLVEAAAALSELLAGCPNLELVVTSRELLRLPGEQAYPVPPLEALDGEQLFLARAHAVRPDFAATRAVKELCARLENLPLALELAAARVRVLSPEQLLERLSQRLDLLRAGRGTDPRQQTLRATIEWSHELLDESERRLFARLAVFRGGCTLDAAEQVCAADVELLESLVDKSLLRVRDGDRFWMLETIRDYATERLAASGEEDELRRRHAERFLTLAEEAAPWARVSAREWLDRLQAEHDNLRAALEWFGSSGRSQDALLLAASLGEFWSIRGYLREADRRLELALAADSQPTASRAKALNAAANTALARGDDDRVKELASQALAIHERFGDLGGAGDSLFLLGHAAADEGEFGQAKEYAERSAALFHEVRDEESALWSVWLTGWAYLGLGQRERGRAVYEELLVEARKRGSGPLQSILLEGLARQTIEEGRPADALRLFGEGQVLNLEMGDRWRTALVACRMAPALLALGRASDAARVLASGLALMAETGAAPSWRAGEDEKTVAAIREQLDEAAFDEAWEAGRQLPAEEAIAAALGEPAQE